MDTVRVWSEPATIPTYEIGTADRNPMFLEKRVYQGSTGKIYPYPSVQEISRTKTDKVWNAVYLENEYLKVMILPELGGRIQRAFDKTNNYDFVYYNQVIKPALVGLTGPWISGGIEFNWPQHHRPTTYSPVDYELKDNGDGSKSVLIHDVDQMYGTKEITTFTLYPGKAFIEIRGQLYNRTPLPQTFLWWANPAVPVNDFTQSVFPPDVHSVYDHGKRAVSRFPIATGEYYKHDYSEGVDISRYKNIPVPTSYMAERSDYDFVGGYDYRKKAGLLHVADHHYSPGKKQWTWGCGDFGRAWDRNLTDEDGPYIELMTGVYCDNQPDFSWLKPYEEKVFKQYFMPYKAVGQVKNASIHAALNLEVREEGLYICVYATQVYDDAQIIISYDGEEIFREETGISPVDIFEKTLSLSIPDPYRVRAAVFADGRELVAYQPEEQGIPKLAEPAKAAKDPKEIMTNEELYLTGQHIEQYRHATYLPDPYYLEGLKRDEEDIRINNAYGLLLLRRGCFEKAESYFRKALERLTRLNPNPYDSEPYYNLGLSLFYQERFDEAYDAFYKATWTNEQQEMSFYYLAGIALRRGDLSNALELAEKGLVKNIHNIKARGLKAVILGRMGRTEEAFAWIEENLKVDTFDYVSRFEDYFLTGCKAEKLDTIRSMCRNFRETFLQIARDYAEFGEYEKAVAVLDAFDGDYPMIHYYKGFFLSKMGKTGEAAKAFRKAEKSDPTCCFPNKPEDIQVLYAAIAANPEGGKAPYYLGNLFYDRLQFEEAIRLWEMSEKIDDSFPTLERNLSIAYYNKKSDPERALARMERAFALDPGDARVFLELDQLYVKLGYGPERRLEKFEENIDLIQKRDDLYTEYVTVLNLNGKYREAYDAIMAHDFQTWEGAEGKITTQFKVALLEMAKEALRAAEAAGAESKADAEDDGSGKDSVTELAAGAESKADEEDDGAGKDSVTELAAGAESKAAEEDDGAGKDSVTELAAGAESKAAEEDDGAGKDSVTELAAGAEKLLKEAMSYPHNLGEGRLEGTKDNHLYYTLGLADELLGKKEESAECFEKATLGAMEPAGMMYYYDQPADMILYQGWAKEKQGLKREANARFYKLVDYGEQHVRDRFKMDYFAVSMPDMSVFDADMTEKNRIHCYYLMGLGKLGLGRKAEAAADFERVLKSDPNHQNAAIYKRMAEE